MHFSHIDDSDDNLESSEADSSADIDAGKGSEDAVIWDTFYKIPLYSSLLGHVSNIYLVNRYRTAARRRVNKSKNAN